MMRTAAIVAGMLLAAAIGYGLGFQRGSTQHEASNAPAGPSIAPATPPRAPQATLPSATSGARLPTDFPTSALPPANTPVAGSIEDLRRAAQSGDVRAACRLGFEFERCHGLRAQRASIATFRDLSERPGVGAELARRYAAIAERDLARLQEVQKLCEGVSAKDAAEGWRYELQAARAGYGPAMVRFASRQALADQDPVVALEGFAAFRNEAPLFLQRAADLGYPEAYEQLAFSYVTGMDLGLGVPRDAVKGVAYYTALMRVGTTDEVARLQRAVDYAVQSEKLRPEDLERARAMAEPLAAKLLARNAPGSIDFTHGVFAADNGSHCER
jgi:hypothetical protein